MDIIDKINEKTKIKRFRVYGLMTASTFLGEYDAKSKVEAEKMAEKNNKVNWNVSVCHQCSKEVELGDIYELQTEEVK